MSVDSHGNVNPQGTGLVPEPQDEALPTAKIAAVGIVTLLIFAVSVVWATQILLATTRDIREESGEWKTPQYVDRAEIGIVDMTLFSKEVRAQELMAAKISRIESAGWVSRKENIVHIPIRDAMQAIVQGKRLPATQPQMQQPAPPAPDQQQLQQGLQQQQPGAPGQPAQAPAQNVDGGTPAQNPPSPQ